MISQKGVVILCCLFVLSAAVPIREEASGATSIAQHKCEKDGEVYETGAHLNNKEEPCQLCYCQKGTLVCAVINCYHRDDCEPHFVPGRCCPKYDHCPALGEKKDEVLLPVTNTVEDDIKEFALGDDPSSYFAGNLANSSSEEHKSTESFETDIKPESVAWSEEEQNSRTRNDQQHLDLFKSFTDILVESSTDNLQNEGKNAGEPNLSEMQQQGNTLDSKDGNDSESTEDIMAEGNAKPDYQNEESEDENIQQNAGEKNLSEMQQEKSLDSEESNDNRSSEETIARSIVKLGYQDEENQEENNQQNIEDAQSSEYKENLQSKEENYGSNEVQNGERKMLEHQYGKQDAQQNIGEQDSEMHPFKEQLISTENNQGVKAVIHPDYQDDENEQSSQQSVGEPDASEYEENKQSELEYYVGNTDIITTESNAQDEEHIGKQDSSELYLNGESSQHKIDGVTEEVITEMDLNQDEQEYKQENEQPVGEQASLETNLDENENNYDTTEVIVTESYVNPDHQDDEQKTENNQPNEGESNFSEMPLDEERLQSKEESDDGATEMMPVKKNIKHDHQDKYENNQHSTGELHSSENHYSEEESIIEVAATERSMNLNSDSEENHIEKKQQDEGELHLSETQESEEKMDNTHEATEAASIDKIPAIETNTPILSSHDDITELSYSAKQAEAIGEGMESDYTIYRGEYIDIPRTAHYVKVKNEKLNYTENKVYKAEATEDTDTSTLNNNSTDENISREKESNEWLKSPYSEEGSGSSRIYDCAGGKEECAFLVKEWKILMPQLAMTPLPSPSDFWDYYDYSSSEVHPVSYNDPEEVLILLPHPPQDDQNVAEALDNTAEFAKQHKVQDTNHIL